MRRTNTLLLLASLGACGAFGCRTCPDLSVGPLQLRVRGELDANNPKVLFDVEPLAPGAPALRALDLIGEGVPKLAAGRYRVVARRAGREIGRIEALCTAGTLLGCAAEDATEDDAPVIALDPNADGGALQLVRDGRCP